MSDKTKEQEFGEALFEAMSGGGDEEGRAAYEKEVAFKEALVAKAVDKIMLESFGIRSEGSDALSTSHPVLAGVARRALRDAYGAGVSDMARRMIDQMVKNRAKPR